jgi:ribose/xylose/arabinose/galactoside ABC-type transport system permease subunit
MSEIKLNVGMLAATCALCAAEVAVDSPAYENLVAAVVCTCCGSFGLYLGFDNVKTAITKTKGPLKGGLKQARKKLPGK